MNNSWRRLRALPLWMAVSALLSLTACGGADDVAGSPPALTVGGSAEPGASAFTGNAATDAFNRFNFRRQETGLSVLTRNAALDTAAQGHSDYERLNGVTTHAQEVGRPGFTGVQPNDRLRAAGYAAPSRGYAIGEVVASRSDASGIDAAQDLIGSVYDRFVVFEPMFKEGGSGAATNAGGTTWFTVDFAAIGLDGGLPAGQVAVYPFAGQTSVPALVDTDQQYADPVPDRNRVGYPVSVHANLVSTLAVQSFTIRPRGGADLAVRTLAHDTDALTPQSAAALIPLSAFSAATTYDVQFTGTVDGTAVSRSWSFTTR